LYTFSYRPGTKKWDRPRGDHLMEGKVCHRECRPCDAILAMNEQTIPESTALRKKIRFYKTLSLLLGCVVLSAGVVEPIRWISGILLNLSWSRSPTPPFFPMARFSSSPIPARVAVANLQYFSFTRIF